MSLPPIDPTHDPNAPMNPSGCDSIGQADALQLTPNDAAKVAAKAMGLNPCTRQASATFEIAGSAGIGGIDAEASGGGSISESGCEALSLMGQQIATAQATIACAIQTVYNNTTATQNAHQDINFNLTGSVIEGDLNITQSIVAGLISESVFDTELKSTIDSALDTMITNIASQDVAQTTGFAGGIFARGGKQAQTYEEEAKQLIGSTDLQTTQNNITNQQLLSQELNIFVLNSTVKGDVNLTQDIQVMLVSTNYVTNALEQFFTSDIGRVAVNEWKQTYYQEERGVDDLAQVFASAYMNVIIAVIVVGGIIGLLVAIFALKGMGSIGTGASMLGGNPLSKRGKIIFGVGAAMFLIGIIVTAIGGATDAVGAIVMGTIMILIGIAALGYIIKIKYF